MRLYSRLPILLLVAEQDAIRINLLIIAQRCDVLLRIAMYTRPWNVVPALHAVYAFSIHRHGTCMHNINLIPPGNSVFAG